MDFDHTYPKMIAPSVLVVIGLIIPFVQLGPIENYYWKDFNGLIPNDAYEYNSERYIGSAPFDSGVFVGELRNLTHEIVVAGYHRSHIYNATVMNRYDNIKILCTCKPYAVLWIKTNSTNFLTIPYDPVIGGYGNGSIYIGRNLLEEKVGRISNEKNFYNMYYVNGTAVVYNDEYHILVHNPDVKCSTYN